MRDSIVDENVLRTANGDADHVGFDCQLACIDFLQQCYGTYSLVLDAWGDVLSAYASACNYSGQPGVGDEFFRWLVEHIAVFLTLDLPLDSAGEYVHFPNSRGLANFDADDRKWVALTVAAGPDAQLVNAVDSDYAHHAAALSAAGVDVLELCPAALKPLARGRMRP